MFSNPRSLSLPLCTVYQHPRNTGPYPLFPVPFLLPFTFTDTPRHATHVPLSQSERMAPDRSNDESTSGACNLQVTVQPGPNTYAPLKTSIRGEARSPNCVANMVGHGSALRLCLCCYDAPSGLGCARGGSGDCFIGISVNNIN